MLLSIDNKNGQFLSRFYLGSSNPIVTFFGSYYFPSRPIWCFPGLFVKMVFSSALIIFLQLYQKKEHSHAKKYVRMYLLYKRHIRSCQFSFTTSFFFFTWKIFFL